VVLPTGLHITDRQQNFDGNFKFIGGLLEGLIQTSRPISIGRDPGRRAQGEKEQAEQKDRDSPLFSHAGFPLVL